MKRRFMVTLILALCILLCFTFAASAAGAEATVTVDTVSAFVGDTATIAVSLTENPGIMSAYFDVTYSEGLTLQSCKNEGLLGTGDVYLASTPKNNAFAVSWDNAKTGTNTTKTGTLLTLTFKVADTAAGKLSVTVKPRNNDRGNIIDNNACEINVPSATGGVTVKTPAITGVKRTAKGLKIVWNKLSGAESYNVYRNGSKTAVATNVTGTSYEDKKLTSGTTYSYTIRAVKNGKVSPASKALSCVWLAPANLSSVANAEKGVQLKWSKVTGATGYYVWRKEASGSWSRIVTVKSGSTVSHIDTTAKAGKTYQYRLQTVKNDVVSENGSALTTLRLTQPSVTVANAASGITVSWKKITGAKGYYVYRQQYSGGKWSRIKTTTAVSYTDTAAKAGVKYQYTVRAYNGDYISSYKGVAIVRLTQPSVTVANAASGITASWKKITGAKGYIVYRRQSSGGKWSGWTKLKTTTALSYTDTSAKAGVNYQYTARAYNSSYQSSFAGKSILRLTQPAVTVANAASGITASWKKVAGAKGYIVYRRQSSGGKWSGWTKIKTTTSLSYTDKTAKAGVTYQYTARAYNSSYQSSFVGKTIRRLTQPTVKAAKVSNGIKVSWNKSTGASGYYVYRRQYSKSKWSGWQKIKTTTSLSYTDKTAKKGVQYQYTARAYNGSCQSSYKASSTIKR